MIPIEKIKAGQRWAFAKLVRGDVEISWVNVDNKMIHWNYVDFKSNIFDSPYEQFLKDFTPRDKTIIEPEPIVGPNEDRNFLT